MSLLFTSLIISFINAYQATISRIVSDLFTKKKINLAIKSEVDEILAELKTFSMRDEFPRYARLKRRLNKLNDERLEEEKSFKSQHGMLSTKVSYVLQGLLNVGSLVLFWKYRYHPVAELDEDWLYPIAGVLSFPLQLPGAISFPVWFLITNSVSKLFAASF